MYSYKNKSCFKDFTVYIDGDLLLAIIAAIGAAFFFFVYQGITLGRKRRRKRRSMNSNVEGHKNDLEKSSEYWTAERSKKLLPNGKIHYFVFTTEIRNCLFVLFPLGRLTDFLQHNSV